MYGFYLLNAVAKVSSNLQNKTILKKQKKVPSLVIYSN